MFCLWRSHNLAGRSERRDIQKIICPFNPAHILLVCTLFLAACDRLAPTSFPTSQLGGTTTAAIRSTSSPTPEASAVLKPTRTPKPTLTPVPTRTPVPEVKKVLTIHLKTGLKWSDGSDLIARDVVGAYNILWAQNNSRWAAIQDVIARDDTTIDFLLSKPSPYVIYQVLRFSPTAPYSQYKTWMDQAGEARKAGFTPDSPEVKKVLDELSAFKPDSVAASGPFVLKPSTITRTKLELAKNPQGYNADRIDFERMIVYFGRQVDSKTMVLFNKIDYSTYPYSNSDLKRFVSQKNLQVLRLPTGEGPGLWFNQAVYPLDKKLVRQALAYIIDRDQIAGEAVEPAGKAITYPAGLTELQTETWLAPETINRLSRYKKDWNRAEELLKKAGCSQDAQGKWVDDQGKPLSYELSVPDEKADWKKAAEQAAGQLTEFGIPAAVQTYPIKDRTTVQVEGKYQILVDLGVYSFPTNAYAPFAYYLGKPRNNPEAKDNLFGLKWPWNQTDLDGQQYNIPTLLKAATERLDFQSQDPAIQTLALILNDQLPVYPLYEGYTAAPVNLSDRVDGWAALDDPIYQNSQETDNPAAMQFLEGQLKKSAKGDGSFTTVAAYPRTTEYTFNLFDRKNLMQNVGKFPYNVMYPPLFWLRWATGDYAPALAESFEIK